MSLISRFMKTKLIPTSRLLTEVWRVLRTNQYQEFCFSWYVTSLSTDSRFSSDFFFPKPQAFWLDRIRGYCFTKFAISMYSDKIEGLWSLPRVKFCARLWSPSLNTSMSSSDPWLVLGGRPNASGGGGGKSSSSNATGAVGNCNETYFVFLFFKISNAKIKKHGVI